MFKQCLIGIACLGLVAACSTKEVERPDLNKVLDSFSMSLDNFSSAAEVDSNAEASNAVMQEFTVFAAKNLNNPSFTQEKLGLELKTDGSFEGYPDFNKNGAQDADEKTSFKVEVDTEGNRLIATDMTGGSTSRGFSGTGFLVGAIMGSLINRQSKAGISRSSLAAKKANTQSQYSSARSRSFSGSHSSGK